MNQKKIKEGSSYDLNYFSDIESDSDNLDDMDDFNDGSEERGNQGKKYVFMNLNEDAVNKWLPLL